MKPEIRKEVPHPSKYLITRLHAGDLEEQERNEVARHVGECVSCSEVLHDLEKAKTSFHVNHDRDAFIAQVQAECCRKGIASKKNLPWWGRKIRPFVVGFSAATVILVAVIVMTMRTEYEEPLERIKGSEIELGYFIMGEQGPEIAPKNHVLHPRDRIQFRITAPAGGYVHVVGVDEKGTVSVYFPLPNQSPEVFPGGAGRPVPGSVILDDTVGRERVFVLICNKPMSRAKLESRIGKLSGHPESLLEQEALPVSCRQSSILLTKSVGGR